VTSRLPHFLDSRLTDGGEVASLTHQTLAVTGRGSPWGCEMSRLPHFLYSRFTDGGEVVSLTRLPPFTPRLISGTHSYYRLSRPQRHSAAGRIRSVEISNDFIGN
jgi:hypothetical protein